MAIAKNNVYRAGLRLLFVCAAAATVPVLAATAPADSQGTDAANAGALGEIIVTAQKRPERLQDIPVTVTAVNAADLSAFNITNNRDLNMVVPGLSIQAQGSYTLPALRGVTTTLTSLGDEPNIATYVDGVYYPVSFGDFFEFNNIDHIEVLKGPQGSLFGRNATGGAINIVTRTPSDVTTGEFSMGYGRFHEFDLDGYISGPLTSQLSADLSITKKKDDGWARDIYLSRDVAATDTFAARSKLVFRPDDSAKFTLVLDYSRVDDPPPNFLIGGDSLAKLLAPPGTAVVVPSQYGTTASNFAVTNPVTQYGVSLTSEFNFRPFDLISVTAVRQAHADGHFDIDATSLNFIDLYYGPLSRSLSEDLRLQSNDHNARLVWIGGLNLFFDTDSFDPFSLFTLGLPQPQFGSVHTDAYALYGQATYKVTDPLSITVGLRASQEHKYESFSQDAQPLLGSTGIPSTEASHDWNDVSPKVTLDYQFAPKTKGYVTVSKGFKSGAYNVSAFSTKPVDPETLWDYEIGVKSDINEHLRVNAAAFYYDYRNIQVQAFGASAVVPLDSNAASAKMKGLDADITSKFAGIFSDSDSVSIAAGVAYLDARYGRYPGATEAIPNVVPGLGLVGDNIVSADASGKSVINAPRLTVNFGLRYAQLFSFGTLSFSPAVYYNSGYFLDSLETPRFEVNSFTRFNADLTWQSVDTHYSVSLWGKNLTNVQQLGGVLASALGAVANSYPPATYGIRVGYRF
jgi:iron complex outermembrane receptor protein